MKKSVLSCLLLFVLTSILSFSFIINADELFPEEDTSLWAEELTIDASDDALTDEYDAEWSDPYFNEFVEDADENASFEVEGSVEEEISDLAGSQDSSSIVYLPTSLSSISPESFYNTSSLTTVVAPRGLLSIQAKAFARSSLKQINLPETVVFIADDAFEACDGLTITTPKGSYAWNWAKSHGIACKAAESGTVTYAAYMKMLDEAVERIDPNKLDAWKARFPEARASKEIIDKVNASIAIFAAAETIGGDVYARNLNDTGEGCFSNNWKASPVWGDVEREVEGFELSSGGMKGKFIDWSSHYVTSRGSIITGMPLFEYPAGRDKLINEPLNAEAASLSCQRFVESSIKITKRYPNADDEALLSAADARKREILNSSTNVSYTGTAYYVSNNGNDNASGRTPDDAWATLGKVSRAGQEGLLKPGDAVFLERGGIWRGEVLYCAKGVTYSAYGTGEKPKIYGSEENYIGSEKWNLFYNQNGVKIWKLYRDVSEVGNIVFNDGTSYATRKYAYYNGSKWVFAGWDQRPFDVIEALNDDLTFCCTFELTSEQFREFPKTYGGDILYADMIDTVGPLYLRCDAGNPGELYNEIEFHQTPDRVGYTGLVHPVGDNVIDNLCIRYSVRNGIAIYGNGNANPGNGNNTIQNCEISWAGGDQHDLCREDGDVMVCGECIVWKTDDNKFLNNYISQGCCAGLVSEFVANEYVPEITCYNTIITGNVFEKCQDTLFFHDNGYPKDDIVFWDGVEIKDNYVLHMGWGWSNDSRFTTSRNKVNTFHQDGAAWAFSLAGKASHVRNMTIENNVFYLTNETGDVEIGGQNTALLWFSVWDDLSGLTFRGNTYVENDNRRIFLDHALFGRLTTDQIKEALKEYLGDSEAVVFETSVEPSWTVYHKGS